MKKVRGFTLIELMIVLAVAVILTTVAVSAYSKQARRSHRYDGAMAVASVHANEQKYRFNHAKFGTLPEMGLGASPYKSIGGYYDVTVELPPGSGSCAVGTKSDKNSYKIIATAIGDQAKDTGCATMVLTNLCGVITKTSTGGDTCWPN